MDLDELTAFRRDMHRYAEPAFAEIGTAVRIEAAIGRLPVTVTTGSAAHNLDEVVNYPSVEVLDEWADRARASGLPADRVSYFRENGTALIVDLEGNRPGPRWGLRVDIDALPMFESDGADHLPARLGFRSPNKAMHACGHDAHTTMGIGLLHRLRDRDFAGSLRVLFQPAEEGVRGAQTMIEAAAVDTVDRMLAIHVAGEIAVGTVVGSCTGGLATRKLLVNFTGRASHAAGAPEQGRNALLAAAVSATGIMSIPRYSTADTRLNVGTLHAGDGVNIVPATAELTCEARATDDDIVDEIVERIRAVVAGSSLAYGVSHEVAIMGRASRITPDPELVDAIVAVAQRHPAVDTVVPTMDFPGSDDANLLIRRVQQQGGTGAYMMVGTSSPGPHHSENFDIDEGSILVGIDLLESLIR